MMKPSIPKGTRDFGPLQVTRRKYIMGVIEKVFRTYGFMPLETPAMENLSTLTGKYGDEGDKLLFKILNSGDYLKDINDLASLGSQKLTPQISEKGLRYDLTVPLARYVVMSRNDITLPFRRYQMQPVWRADRPQRGRYREFWQCDADIVGSDSLTNELDLIQIYEKAFTNLNLPVTIRINNRKILAALTFSNQNAFVPVTVILDKLDKIGEEQVIEELNNLAPGDDIINNISELIRNRANADTILDRIFTNNPAGQEGLKEVRFLIEQFKKIDSDHKINLEFDVTLARGLGYYTGTIFEVVANTGTLKSSIGGGGRYDDLTGIFGMSGIPGVGISFGLDRIYDILDELKLFPEDIRPSSTKVLFCAFDQESHDFALQHLRTAREAGIPSELYPSASKIKKQLDYADSLKIPYCVIIGENERNSGDLTFKNMTTGEQRSMKIAAIIESITQEN